MGQHTSVSVETRLGQRIASERRLQKLTYDDLAAQIQLMYDEVLTSRTIRNLESAKTSAKISTLKLVLGALAHVPKEELDSFMLQLLTEPLRKRTEVQKDEQNDPKVE